MAMMCAHCKGSEDDKLSIQGAAGNLVVWRKQHYGQDEAVGSLCRDKRKRTSIHSDASILTLWRIRSSSSDSSDVGSSARDGGGNFCFS